MIKMKDSGVEWIGVVPKNWEIERLQWHLFEIVEKNDPIKTTQVLSLTNKKGVIPYEEKGNQGNTAKENYDGYKIAYPDTIVANSMNILIGSVGYSKLYGCVSPVYYVFKEKNNNDLRFINYIMQTSQFQRELRKCANGILEIRLRVSASDILKQKCAFPNIQTQTLISDYLDEKCAKIDEIIAKQQAVIEKLKEYKLSIITEAVTKGLNQDVEMKDSGIEWIGKIPVHWTIRRASTLSERIVVGVVIRPSEYFDSNGTIPFLRGMNVKDFKISTKDLVFISEESNKVLNKSIVHEGDILIVRDGNIGASCIVPKELDGSNVVSMIIFTANSECTSNYICYCLNSCVGKNQFEITKIGSALTHTSVSAVSRLIFSTPPIEEQRDIVAYLDKKCDAIDKTIESKYTIVEKLIEYKKSLIYEVVTGKKEV